MARRLISPHPINITQPIPQEFEKTPRTQAEVERDILVAELKQVVMEYRLTYGLFEQPSDILKDMLKK